MNTPMSVSRLVGITVFAVTVAGAVGAAGAAAPELLLVPARLDLGVHPPDALASGSAWLVNTGRAPVELRDAVRSCGCIERIEVGRQVVPALGAIEIPVSVHAPRFPGRLKPIDVTFILSAGDPLSLPIHIETTGKAAGPAPIAVHPLVLDLGTIAAAAPVEDVLVLANTRPDLVDVIKVLGSDGSIAFPLFGRMLLEEGETIELLVSVTPPLEEAGRAMTKEIKVFAEGAPPASASVRYQAQHAPAASVLGYLEAIRAADRAKAASFLAAESRLWAGTREGPGVALSAETPWGESAGLLRAGRTQDTVRLEDDGALTMLTWSIEDPATGRRAPAGRLTFRLDGAGRITEILCEPISIGGKERSPA